MASYWDSVLNETADPLMTLETTYFRDDAQGNKKRPANLAGRLFLCTTYTAGATGGESAVAGTGAQR